jgi:4-hydroxyphenylacetate 3-monooxygenase
LVGSERVHDVASHPGFRGAADTIARIFDLKFDPACRADMVVEGTGEPPYSAYFLAPRTRAELEQRARCHRRIAELTYGLLGRSPDHVAGLVTGLAMEAGVLGVEDGRDRASCLLEYHRSIRARDAYVAYAVLPHRRPAGGSHDPMSAAGLRVVAEDADGVVLRGVKGLATAAALADEVWIGNLQPLAAGADAEAITCVVPCNAPGLQIWSRRPFAAHCASEFDSPLTWRYDEGDAVLVLDDVRVGWDRVFVHRDPVRSSEIYIRSPAHALANHQSAVRSLAKARLVLSLADRVAAAVGVRALPAVRDTLGRLAALESTLAALVDAQVDRFERWPGGGVAPNRRYVYAALSWCQERLPELLDALRELSASGAFRFPADASAVSAPELGATFARLWGAPGAPAVEQMRLFRLVWDLTGSEFAGRQQQYELFYAGPPHVVRGHSHREAPWGELAGVAGRVLAREPEVAAATPPAPVERGEGTSR